MLRSLASLMRLRRRAAAWAAVASLAAGAPLLAQQPQHQIGGNEGKRPPGWQVRADGAADAHAGSDTLSFVQMTPGFHVTTGPGTIFWHPDSAARGTYAVEAGIFLFPTKGRDQEGYGIFVGGADLAGAGQRYTYFLLRNDGKFLVKQRVGATTSTLVDWTAHAAIKRQSGNDAMRNDLRIEADAETVRFLVNGAEAAQVPRARVRPDGVFGLRLNHAINAHVVHVKRGS
ncbi:MAG: hypothetical protein LCH84_08985 [Gemmatimonadetes bacterium]|nr:hypothetical protein [Gemmatimonadota bacterium]